MEQIKKRKKALAKHLSVNASDIVFNEDEELLEYDDKQYYVFSHKELKEREFETFECLNFEQFLKYVKLGIALSFSNDSKRVDIRTLSLKDTEYGKNAWTTDTVDNLFNNLVEQSAKKAFKKTNYLDNAIKNIYDVVNNFYIRDY